MKTFITKISFVVIALISSLATYANLVSMKDFSIKPGETKTVEVNLNTTKIINVLEFTLHMPEGLTCVEGSSVYSDRIVSSMLDGDATDNGATYFFTTATGTIAAGDSWIVKFDVKASDDFQGGKIVSEEVYPGTRDTQEDFEVNVTVEKDDPVVPSPAGVSMKDFSIEQGTTKTIEVNLNTTKIINVLEFTLHMPKGLTCVEGSSVYSDRIVSSMLDGDATDNGATYFFTTATGTIAAGDSWIVKFDVKASKDFQDGIIVSEEVYPGTRDTQEDFEVKVTAIPNTAIDAIQTISDDAVIYNIAGQRVNANAKGLVIKNGKKFINK